MMPDKTTTALRTDNGVSTTTFTVLATQDEGLSVRAPVNRKIEPGKSQPWLGNLES